MKRRWTAQPARELLRGARHRRHDPLVHGVLAAPGTRVPRPRARPPRARSRRARARPRSRGPARTPRCRARSPCPPRRAQVLEELVAVDDRGGGARPAARRRGSTRGRRAPDSAGSPQASSTLPSALAVHRQALARCASRVPTSWFGPLAVEVHHLEAVEHAEVRGLPRVAAPAPRAPSGRAACSERVRAEGLAELEARTPEAVALVLGALLDVAHLLERREQAEHVVLVETEPPGQRGHAELFGVLGIPPAAAARCVTVWIT